MSSDQDKKSIYLIVVNEDQVFDLVLLYAAKMAEVNNGAVGIIHVLERHDFMHWGDVDQRMTKEIRDNGEQLAWQHAGRIREYADVPCIFFIREGVRSDEVLNVIHENKRNVRALFLSGDTEGNNPGPLVSHFSGKGLSELKVPLVIIPENLESTTLDAISKMK